MIRSSMLGSPTNSYRLAPGIPLVDQKRQSDIEMKQITDKAGLAFKKTLKRELRKIEKAAS